MQIADRLDEVLMAIHQATSRSRRAQGEVRLVAVSKKKPVEALREYEQAARAQGIPVIFGENYLQELKLKKSFLAPGSLVHMIGPLQSNKVTDAVRYSDVIESVHSAKILMLIAKAARAIGKVQPIFLQVNIGDDPNKSGFARVDVQSAVDVAVAHRDALELVGLMTITPYEEDPELTRRYFAALAGLRRDLIAAGSAHCFSGGHIALSMGMSADYPVAIEEGADFVRIGTALFGERQE
jgi:pyridoxal phosphate enzyme (YggS family)